MQLAGLIRLKEKGERKWAVLPDQGFRVQELTLCAMRYATAACGFYEAI